MAGYPYSSAPPPPPPPCKNTTSPILLPPPPPPPPPACNHTTPPTLSPQKSPPAPAHYSPSPPSLSPTPCNCNKTTPTLPPPHLPSPPPPPPPPSPYYSPPPPSLSPPPLPPPSPPYSPPVHSPPPPSPTQPSPILPPPSPPSPPSPDYSPPPPKPPKPQTPPPSPSPYPFPPAPSPCPCACPSPWAPSPYNPIPPNYYAPAPSPLSPGNHPRTVIVATFVSLGGVFFLAFIVIGLLSVAMKKKMLRQPGRLREPETEQLSHEQEQEHVHEFKTIPAGTEHVIEMGGHESKVQEVQALPDQGIVQQGEAGPSVTEKKSVDPNVDGDSVGDNQGKVDDSEVKLGEPSNEQSVDKIEDADEGKSNEGNNKPPDDHKDASPNEENKSNAIPEEESKEGASNESQKKPRVPKIPKAKGGKTGKKKHSAGIRKVVNAALTLDPDHDMEQTQDGDSDTEAQDDNKESLPDGTNYGDEKVERQPIEDEQESKERDGKSPSDQTETNRTNSAQDVNEGSNAVGEESNDSKKKLRLPKKNIPATNSANKRKAKHSGISQVLNVARPFVLDEVEQNQDGENGEEQVGTSEDHDDDTQVVSDETHNAEKNVEGPIEDEQEAEDRDGKPLNDQIETNKMDSAQDVKEGSNAAGGESSNPTKKLRQPKKNIPAGNSANKRNGKPSSSSGVTKGKEQPFGVSQVPNPASTFDLGGAGNFQDGDNDEAPYRPKPQDDEETYESEPQDDDAGGSNSADEEVEPPANADADVSNECEQKSLENQSESDNRGASQDEEQESTAITEESIDRSQKPLGNQSYTKNADATQDVEKPYASSKRRQAIKKGEGSSTRSHPQGKIQYPNFGQLLNKTGDVYSEALQSQEDELQHDGDDLNSGGNDSSSAMVSLDDEEGEVKGVSDLFASAQGSRQALSKMVDDKAKVHEMKSGSSNKHLQERQHRTQAKKNSNLGKTGTAASRRDPGVAMVSFEDEDDSVQESEPFSSYVDSYLGQLPTSARGIDQSPIFSRTKTDVDPAEELKSLGEGIYKDKKAEVHALSKDSRRIKGQIKGPGTRIEPPKLNQIVKGRIDDDLGILGKGLDCLGGNQEGGSDKDGSGKDVPVSGQTSRGPQQISNLVQSFAATDEGEICEDEEPSAGEMEPSTEDPSVIVTADDDSAVLRFLDNEYDEEPAESNKDAPPGKPPSRSRTTNFRGKRRA